MKVDDFLSYDTSRAPDRRRAQHTGRGSDSLVLIEAGGFYPKFYGINIKKTVVYCLSTTYNGEMTHRKQQK